MYLVGVYVYLYVCLCQCPCVSWLVDHSTEVLCNPYCCWNATAVIREDLCAVPRDGVRMPACVCMCVGACMCVLLKHCTGGWSHNGRMNLCPWVPVRCSHYFHSNNWFIGLNRTWPFYHFDDKDISAATTKRHKKPPTKYDRIIFLGTEIKRTPSSWVNNCPFSHLKQYLNKTQKWKTEITILVLSSYVIKKCIFKQNWQQSPPPVVLKEHYHSNSPAQRLYRNISHQKRKWFQTKKKMYIASEKISWFKNARLF